MKTGFISVGDSVLEALLAVSEHEQQRGLMFVEQPVPYMAFLYNEPRVNKFWMQNTPSDLDIVFCYKNKVSQIHHGKPFSTQTIGNNEFSDLVIELPFGTCREMGIKIGSSAQLLK